LAQTVVFDFSHLKLDLNKAYRICMAILDKPLIKSRITARSHLYANNTPTFLAELEELGFIEKVVLPTNCSGGRGSIIIRIGNRKQIGLVHYRLTTKGLEFLREVGRNGGYKN